MIDLYEMKLAPVCGRVRFALEVKKLPYTSRIHVPVLTDWKLKRVADKVMVPILVDGAKVAQGSDEILEYLDKRHPEPNLLGNNEAEAAAIDRYVAITRELQDDFRTDIVVRLRAEMEDVSRETPLGFLPGFARIPAYRHALDRFSAKWACNEGDVETARARISEALRTVAPQLRPGSYLVGGRLTAADISICELTLLFRPPAEEWLKLGFFTRQVYNATWLDTQIAYPFESWRDFLYKTHRLTRSAHVGAAG